MNLVQAEINSGIRGQFSLNQLDRSDPVEARMYENRRLEEIAMAQPSGRVIVRKRNSAVSAAEKRCLWGCAT